MVISLTCYNIKRSWEQESQTIYTNNSNEFKYLIDWWNKARANNCEDKVYHCCQIICSVTHIFICKTWFWLLISVIYWCSFVGHSACFKALDHLCSSSESLRFSNYTQVKQWFFTLGHCAIHSCLSSPKHPNVRHFVSHNCLIRACTNYVLWHLRFSNSIMFFFEAFNACSTSALAFIQFRLFAVSNNFEASEVCDVINSCLLFEFFYSSFKRITYRLSLNFIDNNQNSFFAAEKDKRNMTSKNNQKENS